MLRFSAALDSRIADGLVGVDPALQFWAIFSVLFPSLKRELRMLGMSGHRLERALEL